MASSNEQLWKHIQKSEKELQANLERHPLVLKDLNSSLSAYRTVCVKLVFHNFDFAQKKNVEAKLWDGHTKVNSCFRKHLAYFKGGEGKRKIVEQRKAAKAYLEFVKASQRFYRGYVQQLASACGDIPELNAIARRLSSDAKPDSPAAAVADSLRAKALFSGHQTLVRLGDLSRYRETELRTEERNWGPAKGYYDLASTLRPSSGASHNQLAVIALVDGSHLRAIYHFYRALAVEEPYPTAKANLELEFKKILSAREKGRLIDDGLVEDPQGSGKGLLGWFVLLHAKCYDGADFSEHDELESEVLSQLTVDLKDRPIEGTLHRICLISIAAEHFAGVRFQADPNRREPMQAFYFFQRLNVKIFSTLLRIMQSELEDDASYETGRSEDIDGSEKITPVIRRIVIGLRHYSTWLLSSIAFLLAESGDSSVNDQIRKFWRVYATTLTLLAATFSVSALRSIDYLLEEDEDTIGFKPFHSERARRRYDDQVTGKKKPRFHDECVERYHPNIEILGRLRDFLTDGLELALDEEVPVDLVSETTTFAYREEKTPSEIFASSEGHNVVLVPTSISHEDPQSVNQMSHYQPRISDSGSTLACMSTTMTKMVDNLVDSDLCTNDGTATRNPPHDGTVNKLTGTAATHEYDQAVPPSTPRPAYQVAPRLLPSILNSPFAPSPKEAVSIGRPTAARLISPLDLPQSLGREPDCQIIESSYDVGSIPDTSSLLQGTPLHQRYRRGRPIGEEIENTTFGFNGSPWSSSGAKNMQTPPNGQDFR